MTRLAYLLSIVLWTVTGRSVSAGCGTFGGVGPAPASPALEGAVLATFGFIAVTLGGCFLMGVILYRRSKAPRLPHLDLIEELETYRPDAPSY